MDTISQGMGAENIPFSIFLDLSKAFDTLDHNVLSSKLNYYRVRDTVLNWFKSYLNKCTQYVDRNGISTSVREIETSVPQGSRLLFIIYANDIHTVSDNLNFIMYADDTSLRSPMCSFTRGCDGNIIMVSASISSGMNNIADVLAVNKLLLNVQKVTDISLPSVGYNGNDIPWFMINNTLTGRVTEWIFFLD